jgi:hypothetical protein
MYEQAAFTGSSALAVDVLVRSERDPYLYFLDISDGLRDFGLKRSEKVRLWGSRPSPLWTRQRSSCAVRLRACGIVQAAYEWLMRAVMHVERLLTVALCCAADDRLLMPWDWHSSYSNHLRHLLHHRQICKELWQEQPAAAAACQPCWWGPL